MLNFMVATWITGINLDITVSAVGGFHYRKNSHEAILKNGNRLPGAYLLVSEYVRSNEAIVWFIPTIRVLNLYNWWLGCIGSIEPQHLNIVLDKFFRS